MNEPPPKTVMGPINRCIYCGATRYNKQRAELGDEHVLARGLGGRLILSRASCRKCEEITGRIESIVLNSTLASIRMVTGIKGRKTKTVPRELPLYDASYSPPKKVMISSEDYPIFLPLPILEDARVLTGLSLEETCSLQNFEIFDVDYVKLISKYNLNNFKYPPFDSSLLMRMLAKIAHGFTICNLGFGEFYPTLNEIILSDEADPTLYVGGYPDRVPREAMSYQIDPATISVRGTHYFVTQIRLFGIAGTPIYRVVSGIITAKQASGLPQLPGGIMLHPRGPVRMKFSDFPQLTPPLNGRGAESTVQVPELGIGGHVKIAIRLPDDKKKG